MIEALPCDGILLRYDYVYLISLEYWWPTCTSQCPVFYQIFSCWPVLLSNRFRSIFSHLHSSIFSAVACIYHIGVRGHELSSISTILRRGILAPKSITGRQVRRRAGWRRRRVSGSAALL